MISKINRGFFLLFLIFSFNLIWTAEIHELITNDDIEGLKTILTANPEFIELEDENGLSPLNFASFHGKLEIMKYLLNNGADILHGDNENSNPLHNASANGQLEVVKFLITTGIDVNLRDNNFSSALDFASSSGNLEIVKLLLDNGININTEDQYGGVPIHSAVYSGNIDVVKLLVEKGADVNASNRWDVMPIHYAAWRGHTEIVTYLLELGADINAVAGSGEVPLAWAVVASRYETADNLLENGADINFRGPEGDTPIFAAHKSSIESIQYMLDNGADINIADSSGTTALIRCGWGASKEVIKLLIDNGADINARNDWGQTILMNTIRSDSLETVRMLLDMGAKFEFDDCLGDACINLEGSALHQAVKMGKLSITELLLDKGADVNFLDLRYNRTPLHWAAIKGYTDLSELLLNKKADPELKDSDKHTAMYYAKKYSNKTIVSLLLDQDAKNMKVSKFDRKDFINEPVRSGEAAVWYLGHSGWGILTENNFIIIDYWLWQRTADQPSLNNGAIDPEEIKGKKVTVFASHEHGDHYDPTIWEWRDKVDDITYILGCQPETEEEYIFLPARKDTVINDIRITTIDSNDSGLGFLLEVDGLTILHPGDHANRERDFSGTYMAEIEFLKEKQLEIDLSFMPMNGCGFGDLEAVRLGVYRTLEELTPKVFFPMHAIGNEYRYNEFIQQMEEDKDYKVQSIAATHIGDRFYFKKGKIKF